MKIHFFSRTDLNNRSAFRVYYILQNLKAIKRVSLICFILSLLVRIFFSLPGLPAETVNHIKAYNPSNWIGIIVNAVFYLCSNFFIKRFNTKNNFLTLSQYWVILYSLFLIAIAMHASFFSMYNPRNTLLMYLLGVMVVGVFFTLEFYETIFLAIASGICFSIMLPFYQSSANELILNNLASAIMLIIFFCISRFLFSYRADNFMKLRFIEQKNTEIENASQMKNEILGIVAHDLRNPLTAIKFVTSMMEMDGKLDQENSEYLQLIKTSCDKASSIINDLLEMAHNDLESELEMQKVELNNFLQEIIEEWQKNRNLQQVKIIYKGSKQPVYTFINKQKMHRVMDNLISNAIKFSDEVGHIEVSVKEGNNVVYINVKDFGIGIPQDLLPYIFDRFSKASRKGTHGEASVGLGLSIVEQIVKKHSGEIEVDSVEEQGTTFTIKLPVNAA